MESVKKAFYKKLEADYREQSNDPEWQAEIELWDCVTSDGLYESVGGMTKLENNYISTAEIKYLE